MLKDLNMLMVYVREMPRSVAFYRDVLGFKLQHESPGFSQFDLGGGVNLGLHGMRSGGPVSEPSGQAGWVPSFSVEDVRAAKERVSGSAGRLTGDFHDIPGGVIIEIADPDGNPISVMQAGITCADLGVASATN